jgi:undecaprenyl-diphosphatase
VGILEAVILGVIQGIAEFIPVSSSGHLAIFETLFQIKEPAVLYNVLLHVATLLSILVYYRNEIFQILRSLKDEALRRRALASVEGSGPGARTALLIVVASVPTGLMGIAFQKKFEAMFGSPGTVGFMFLITGLLLFLADLVPLKTPLRIEEMALPTAVLVGFAQGIAIAPGISRSGATIAALCLLGYGGKGAARFSFLLSIPAVAGAAVLESRKIVDPAAFFSVATCAGFATAFLCGLVAIKLVETALAARSLKYFALYVVVLGTATLLLF